MVSGLTRPELECLGCGKTHYMSPGAMAMVITGFMRGIMQTIVKGEIVPKCLLTALAEEELLKLYKDRVISANSAPGRKILL